jgi:hypothetical protein
MIIKCQYCKKEFDKASHRNQHERDAHKTPAPMSEDIKTVLTDEQKAQFVADICSYGTDFVAPLFL